MRRALLVAIAVSLVLTGCGGKKHRASAPRSPVRSRAPSIPVPIGTTETGVASWYGHPYHGRPAANGEIYDMEKMVAAHRTLPFDTWVRVENLVNGKSVNLRIIDRGPFIGGRIIDVSHAAAIELGLIGPGIARVRLEVVSAPLSTPPAAFGVQVGAFRDQTNAERLRDRMEREYGGGRIVVRQGSAPLYRVLAGNVPTSDAAEALAERIRTGEMVPQAFVVRLDQ